MQAQGAAVSGEERGVESQSGRGVDVLKGIVSEIKGFSRFDAVLFESHAQDFVKARVRLGL